MTGARMIKGEIPVAATVLYFDAVATRSVLGAI
jgi:hypothetical protein